MRWVAFLCLLAQVAPAATLQRRSSPIAITDDGRRLLTANPDSQSVSIVDLGARAVVSEIRIGGTPQTVCITPDGARAFVPTREGFVTVIDLAAYRTTGSIAVGSELFGAVCDSSRMYVSATATSRVLVFELPSLRQIAVIPPRSFRADWRFSTAVST